MRSSPTIGLLLSLAISSSDAAAAANTTVLISRPSGLGALPPTGDGFSSSGQNAVSGDGRMVAFTSSADDLGVVEDFHVYVRDRLSGTVTLVDRAPGPGAPGNASTVQAAAISRDGSKVCFLSAATNLVAGVSGTHVFVTTLATGETTVADRATGISGALGDGLPFGCALDRTGARVVFDSFATNLVPGDSNDTADVFVRDLGTSTTTRVSVTDVGAQSPNGGRDGVISADGLKVAFSTLSPLFAADTNGREDVYVRNLQTNALVRASVGTGNVQGNGQSSSPSIDDAGTHIAFVSDADNLDLGPDDNDRADVFWRDLGSDTTILMSRATGSGGALGDNDSFAPAISGNGLGVAFGSSATTLGAGPPARGAFWVYLRRLGTNQTTLLSRASGLAGAAADGAANGPALATLPTVAVWNSNGGNLDPDASGDFNEVFVRDLAGPTTELVSRPSGTLARGHG